MSYLTTQDLTLEVLGRKASFQEYFLPCISRRISCYGKAYLSYSASCSERGCFSASRVLWSVVTHISIGNSTHTVFLASVSRTYCLDTHSQKLNSRQSRGFSIHLGFSDFLARRSCSAGGNRTKTCFGSLPIRASSLVHCSLVFTSRARHFSPSERCFSWRTFSR